MTDYAPGTPSWVDLSTRDPEGSTAFYEGLFGWTLAPERGEFGGYRNWLSDGRMVAGMNPMGQVPAWTTYVAVASADETAERVTFAGGSVMAPPMDVGALGRMAVFTDPAGAVFGVWQAGEHRGAEKVNEPGSFAWNDLNTPALDVATAFYPAVFDWDPVERDMGGGARYVVWELDGAGIGGAVQVPEGAPVQWVTWFAVADRDATVARAEELGATVLEPKLDVPGVGLLGVISDPQGAFFGVMQGEMPDE